VVHFYFILFSIIENFLHLSLGYCFNWMVEINFMEMYCQPAKNILSDHTSCKNILKEQKEQRSIFTRAHFSWAVA